MANVLSKAVGKIFELVGGQIETKSDGGSYGYIGAGYYNSLVGLSSYAMDRKAYLYYNASRPLASTIDRIVKAIVAVPPVLYDTATNQYITDGVAQPVLDLLMNPGFGQTYTQYMGDLSKALLLTNNTYIIANGNINTKPLSLEAPKPFNITDDQDSDGWVGRYYVTKYTAGQMRIYGRLGPNDFRYTNGNFGELTHIMGMTDETGLRGNSPILSLVLDLEQNIEGGKHNAATLRNGMTPDGAFIFDPKDGDNSMSDTQFERLKSEVAENKAGANNAGVPLILDGGMKFEQMSLTHKDMDFLNLMKENQLGIAARYGIPLALTTTDAMTMNNLGESVLMFIRDAVTPNMDVLFDGLEKALFPRFKIDRTRYKLTYNPLHIDALKQAVLQEVKTRKEIGVDSHNELRAMMGSEAISDGDDVYIANNMIPVGMDLDVRNPSAESVDAMDDETKSEYKEWYQNIGHKYDSDKIAVKAFEAMRRTGA